MADITTIPTNGLREDLLACLDDIQICKEGLDLGIRHYSGGTIQGRIDDNQYVVKVITAELNRRLDQYGSFLTVTPTKAPMLRVSPGD